MLSTQIDGYRSGFSIANADSGGLAAVRTAKSLASITHERAGLAVQLPALELLAALHEHHASVQAANAGDAYFLQLVAKRREAVDAALKVLNASTADSAVRVKLNTRWKELSAESPEASDGLDAQLELNRLLRQGLTTVSDASGIRVDSDPAIAALLDSLSIKLPLLVENLRSGARYWLERSSQQTPQIETAQSSASGSRRH